MSIVESNRLALNEREAAKMLGLSASQLYNMRKRGTGPKPLLLGKKCVRYAVSEIEKWMSEKAACGVE